MFSRPDDKRKFPRHEIHVPLEVSLASPAVRMPREGIDVSYGGLSFMLDERVYPGQLMLIRMPTVIPMFEARARVAWCRDEGPNYVAGVEFLDARDAERSAMVEQVCAIERYRIEAMKKGRRLTAEQASKEFLAKNSISSK